MTSRQKTPWDNETTTAQTQLSLVCVTEDTGIRLGLLRSLPSYKFWFTDRKRGETDIADLDFDYQGCDLV